MDQLTQNLKSQIYGYKYYNYSSLEEQNFNKCLDLLNSYTYYIAREIEEKQILINSKNIINYHFPDLNREVLTLSTDKFNRLYRNIFPTDDESLIEFIDVINKESKIEDIYLLPIIYKMGFSINGKINKNIISMPSINLLKDYKLMFSDIELGDRIDALSPTIHIHEIIHGLLERNKGSVENYLNGELLSIFMEKVAALDISDATLKLSNMNRMCDLSKTKCKLNKDIDSTESYQYLYSGILADYLFNLYNKGNTSIKKEILSNINSILMGKKVLEDFLASKEISFNNEDVYKVLSKSNY